MKSTCSLPLLESALTGPLPAETEAALFAHLAECEACSAAMERLAVAGDKLVCDPAALLADDPLDAEIPAIEDSSDIDFTVEHLEPSDEPNVLGKLANYDVLEIVGRGGMGIVLKAFDRDLKRCVAIKVLSPQLARSPLARKRFAREAQAIAAVVHPNVLAIHQVQANGPLPYLVMPLVAGESLAQRLAARGALDLPEVLRIGTQAAAGLAAAHEQGLVHRDVKPANILLEKGVERAVLTDFGLARASDDVAITRWGVIAGTPQYMSPEQARGEAVDARSDLFSLGCVLYEMATGVSPFKADSTIATLRRLVDEPPQPMVSLNPELPPWFVGIVERLLSKEPSQRSASQRFASAKEVSELLEQCLAHVQQPASEPLPVGLPKPVAGRGSSRFNWFRLGVLGMIPAALLLVWGGMVMTSDPPEIAGTWMGNEWGTVELTKKQKGEYDGTYTDVFGKTPGKIALAWSPIQGRYLGTWSEGEDRHGKISVRLVDGEIRGAWTTSEGAKIRPANPELSDLRWTKGRQVSALGGEALPAREFKEGETITAEEAVKYGAQLAKSKTSIGVRTAIAAVRTVKIPAREGGEEDLLQLHAKTSDPSGKEGFKVLIWPSAHAELKKRGIDDVAKLLEGATTIEFVGVVEESRGKEAMPHVGSRFYLAVHSVDQIRLVDERASPSPREFKEGETITAEEAVKYGAQLAKNQTKVIVRMHVYKSGPMEVTNDRGHPTYLTQLWSPDIGTGPKPEEFVILATEQVDEAIKRRGLDQGVKALVGKTIGFEGVIRDSKVNLLGRPDATARYYMDVLSIDRIHLGDERGSMNARETAQAYVAALVAGDVARAAALGVNITANHDRIASFAKLLEGKRVAIATVMVDDPVNAKSAIAVTDGFIERKPGEGHDGRDRLLVYLGLRPQGWVVELLKDVSEAVAKEQLDKFSKDNPKAALLPPLPRTSVDSGDYEPSRPKNARETAEAYLLAISQGDAKAAAELAVNRPGDEEAIKETIGIVQGQGIVVTTVMVDQPSDAKHAIAVTKEFTFKDRGRRQSGHLVLTMQHTSKGWAVHDIDFESEDGAKEELDKFVDRHQTAVFVEAQSAIKAKNARETAERWLAAAITGDMRTVQTLGINRGADRKMIDTFDEAFGVDALPLDQVYVDKPAAPSTAVGVTPVVTDTQGVVVVRLHYVDGNWQVEDADLFRKPEADKALAEFLIANPQATLVPVGPLVGSEPVAGTGQLDRTPAFGETKQNLQLGIALQGDSNQVAIGDGLKFEYTVRNTGDGEIKFRYHPLQAKGHMPRITSTAGAPAKLARVEATFPSRAIPVTLKPGEVHRIPYFVVLGDDGSLVPQWLSPEVGTHTIEGQLELELVKAADEVIDVVLATGRTKFTVVAKAEPTKTEGTKATPLPDDSTRFITPTGFESLACSADGKIVAYGTGMVDEKQMVIVLDGETGKTLHDLPMMSPEETATIEELRKGKRLPRFMNHPVVAVSPQGNLIAFGNPYGQVKVFMRSKNATQALHDAAGQAAEKDTPAEFQSVPRAMGNCRTLAFSPDAKSLVVTGETFENFAKLWPDVNRSGEPVTASNQLKVWDVKNMKLKWTTDAATEPHAAHFNDDGGLVLGSASWRDDVEESIGTIVWEAESGRKVVSHYAGIRGFPIGLPFYQRAAISAGVAKVNRDGSTETQLIMFRMPSTVREWESRFDGSVNVKGRSPDGQSLVALVTLQNKRPIGAQRVALIDIATGEETRSFPLTDDVHWTDIAVPAYGKHVFVGGSRMGDSGGGGQILKLSIAPPTEVEE